MIDLHCHLLPGIDDGPDTLEEALELARMAVEDGITHAVVTPHVHPGRWENTRVDIAQHCADFRIELKEHSIPLSLGFAGEVRLTDELMEQVANDDIPFYGEVGGYQVMLLEFPHGHIIPGSEKLVAWLLDRNIRPLIAHPERNKQVMKEPARLLPFIEAGCWLQLTAGSLLGAFGERARQLSEQLMAQDMITVVASDGHNARARPPCLRQAYDHISEHYGEPRAQRLMQEMPAQIVAGKSSEGASTA
jgi:protein-tyrosine phosphatase